MKQSQKKVWDNIAQEWYKFKKNPSIEAIEFLKKQKGNVLDLGSGAGRHLVEIKKGKMYLVDFSKEMIKFSKEKAKKENLEAEFFVSNLTKLSFKNNFFDSAIAIASIHCIKGKRKREKIVKELFRVMKPKSKALIAVWNKDSKRFKNSPKEKYVKWRNKGERYYYLFDTKEVHDLFKKVGFKITKKFQSEVNIVFIVKKP